MNRISIAAVAILLAGSVMAAEPAEREHRMPVGPSLRIVSNFQQTGARVRVPVNVDLTGVTLDSVPAVLGSYVLRADFDPAQVRFVGATGGSAPEFSAAPLTTIADNANAQGWVKVVAVQTSLYGPVGNVSVAQLEFEELVAGGRSTVRLSLESAAAAPTPNGEGLAPEQIELPVARAN